MATPEELFISIQPSVYRENKSSGLMSQVELLHALKHLQNLKVLSRRRNDLRIKFHKLLSSSLRQVNALQNKMPEPSVPETIQKHEELIIEEAPKVKKVFTKRDAIEEELMQIHDKLQELNTAA